MENNNQQNQNQINIELTEELADGTYANLAVITHSQAEFVIDYVNIMPGSPKAKVKSRIIMAPHHAKRLMRALIDNIKNYEGAHGVINDQDPSSQGVPFGFGGTKGEA